MKRNVELVKQGKALDIPLRLFPRKLKQRISRYSYDMIYLKENRIKKNANNAFWYWNHSRYGKSIEEKLEWCLWFIFYYNKEVKK